MKRLIAPVGNAAHISPLPGMGKGRFRQKNNQKGQDESASVRYIIIKEVRPLAFGPVRHGNSQIRTYTCLFSARRSILTFKPIIRIEPMALISVHAMPSACTPLDLPAGNPVWPVVIERKDDHCCRIA
jgi:hypothetical protein